MLNFLGRLRLFSELKIYMGITATDYNQMLKKCDAMKVKMHLVAKRKNPAAKQTDRAALLPRPGMSCNKKSGQTAFLNSCIHCFDVDVRVAEKRSGQTAFLHFCILRFCRRLWHPSIILLTCTKWYGTGHCELKGRVGGLRRQQGGEQVEKSHDSLVRSFARVGGRGAGS